MAKRDALSANTIIEGFHAIDTQLLPVILQSFSEELQPALVAYAGALEEAINSYSFEFAEVVAKRMSRIFELTGNIEIRVTALQAALTAAVRMNRYAAMDTFDGMLAQTGPSDAMAVAEMLREHKSYYLVVADHIPSDRLQAPIRAVRDELSA